VVLLHIVDRVVRYIERSRMEMSIFSFFPFCVYLFGTNTDSQKSPLCFILSHDMFDPMSTVFNWIAIISCRAEINRLEWNDEWMNYEPRNDWFVRQCSFGMGHDVRSFHIYHHTTNIIIPLFHPMPSNYRRTIIITILLRYDSKRLHCLCPTMHASIRTLIYIYISVYITIRTV